MADRILNWLYQFGVKNDYNDLCNKIEMHFETSERPWTEKMDFMFHLRILQVISNKRDDITETDLNTLIGALEDILRYQPLHSHSILRYVLHLYISAKLLIVNQKRLEPCVVLEHFPRFSWTRLKDQFNIRKNELREEWMGLVSSAHKVIQASRNDGTSSLNPDRLKFIKVQLQRNLLVVIKHLKQLLPSPLNLEEIIANEQLQASLTTQDEEYKILLSILKEDVSEESLSNIVAVMTLREGYSLQSVDVRVQDEWRMVNNVRNGSTSVNNDIHIPHTRVNNTVKEISQPELISTLGNFSISGTSIESWFHPKYTVEEEAVFKSGGSQKPYQLSARILNNYPFKVHESDKNNDNDVQSNFRTSPELIPLLQNQIEGLENYTNLLKLKLQEMRLAGNNSREESGCSDGDRNESTTPHTGQNDQHE